MAVTVPLLALSALAILRVHEAGEKVQELALLSQANTLARLADREAELVQLKLKVLSTSSALASGDLDAFEKELRAVSSQHLDATIALVDANGVKLLSTGWPAGTRQSHSRGGAASQEALTTAAPVISDLIRQASTGEAVVAVAVPVFLSPDTARPSYVLAAGVPRARLSALFSAVQPAGIAGWRAVLADRDGRIIVRSLGDDAQIGTDLRGELTNHLLRHQEGFVRGQETIDGVRAVFAYAHAPVSHFAAVLAVPAATFDAPLQADMLRAIGTGGLFLAAGLLGAFLLAKTIVGALRQLEQAHDGPFARTGVREIDELAQRLARIGCERAESQRAIQYQLNLLQAVTESSTEAIFLVGPKGRISFANLEAARLSGWPREDLVGEDLHDLLMATRADGSPYPSAESPLTRVLQDGGSRRPNEEVFRRRDNSAVDVECSSAPILVERETVGAVLIARDVTAQRQAERTLRDSEARLRDLVQTLDLAAILVRDLNGQILFWSRGCEELYGWTVAEAVGQDVGPLLRTIYPHGQAAMAEALTRDGSWSGDLIHTRRDSRLITVAAHKVLRFGPDGEPLAVMECLTDVTSFRAAEAKLMQLNNELEERVAAEITARVAAQARAAHAERMQALGQLAGGIAHDFNNVLQTISSGAALIEQHPSDTPAVLRLSHVIGDAAGRGASITRRMLAFARRSDLQAETIDVRPLLEGLSEICGYTLGPDLRIDIQLGPNVPPLLADKGQLETALINLATNARDAMPQGGVITLAAEAETVREGEDHPATLAPGPYVRLSVRDNGEGMKPHVLARVAEPFFTTKGVGKGTGLGLSMVKGFAEQSDGSLGIESTPGLGTVVRMWLPQAPPDPATAKVRGTTGAAGALRREAGRILLVDDDTLVRETIAAQLEDAGFCLMSAGSGEEALSILENGWVADVLITDLSMPGMNGLSLIRSAQTLRPDLGAILLTGYSGDAASLAVGGAISGSYSLVRKPVPGALLIGRVTGLLEAVPG